MAESPHPVILAERRARRVPALEVLSPPAGDTWTTPPDGGGALAEAERRWRQRHEALRRELAGAAQALTRARETEREKREAILEALATARADLRAARAARAADATSLANLTAELDAERVAHAVTRARAASLAGALATARARLAAAAPPAATAADLERAAHEQSAAAATAARRPPEDTARLLAGLDAAARTLRETSTPPAGDTSAPPSGASPPAAAPCPPRPAADLTAERALRRAVVGLARVDPLAAGRLLLALLPAQAAVLEVPISYDLTVRGLGTFAVTFDGEVARVRRVAAGRNEAVFHLRADALALAELLAADRRRIRRLRGRARATGRRRRTAELRVLAASSLSLAAAARAGAGPEPALIYAALPFAVPPEWTRGHAFTVAQQVVDPWPRTWYVTARDGEGLAVTGAAPPAPPDATVSMTRGTFDRILRGEPPAAGELPVIRGDRAAVETLKEWTDRLRGA